MRKFLIGSRNIERDSYLWNMIGTTLMAFQSVILLMILTRVVGLADAGIFSIAYANANLMLVIGKYGMHNFHVSDTKPMYTFGDYRRSRVLTVLLMLAVSLGYAVFAVLRNGASREKGIILFAMCAWKAVDAIEDVYCSLYQQRGRLDISGKIMTVRLVVSLIFFTALLFVTRSLMISLIASTVFSFLLFLLLNTVCRKEFSAQIHEKAEMGRVGKLLVGCFSLFLVGFLSYYITNAPKYAIDSLLSDELQACYGFISMPVFVIGLLGNYLFNPLIQPMSEHWAKGDTAFVTKRLIRQTFVVLGITSVCLLGAFVLGIPVLSLLYGTDLEGYRTELLLLLAGGGFLAVSNQLMTVIVILRRQKLLIVGYGSCALIALIFASPIVKRWGILGATLLELGLMICLCVAFAILFILQLRRAKSLKVQE